MMSCDFNSRKKPDLQAQTMKKRRRNPLLWGVFMAIGALIPPYEFRVLLDLLLPASGLVFLLLYFLRSRFAWHALAVEIIVIAPAYVLFSPSWRLQTVLHPQIIWFPIVGTCLFAALVFWSRRRYFSYLASQRDAEAMRTPD